MKKQWIAACGFFRFFSVCRLSPVDGKTGFNPNGEQYDYDNCKQ